MKIFKYPLTLTDTQGVYLPLGAKVLSVADQNGNLYLWAIVNPENETTQRIIEIIGTGNPFDESPQFHREFLGTVQQGRFVWHIFERIQ